MKNRHLRISTGIGFHGVVRAANIGLPTMLVVADSADLAGLQNDFHRAQSLEKR